MVLTAALPAVGYMALFFGHRPHGNKNAGVSPRARVVTTKVRKGIINEPLDVYGTVQPLPGKIRVYSVPFEAHVMSVFVTKGQVVKKNDLMCILKPGPSALLSLQQAKTDYLAALAQERLVKQRYRMKLAPRMALLSAQSVTRSRADYMKNLKGRRITGKKVEIRASSPGIVYSIGVHTGQLVAPGLSLVQVADKGHILVNFGVEPEDVSLLKQGMAVQFMPIHEGPTDPIPGRIITITHAVDPATRLVRVLGLPDKAGKLLLNDFVRVSIVTASHNGLIVPRSAVLPQKQGFYLFLVINGHARRVRVRKGLENPNFIEVYGRGIMPGDSVVVQGNYELTDNMSVLESHRK